MHAQGSSTTSIKNFAHAFDRLGELLLMRMLRPWLNIDFLWYLTKHGREETACCEVLRSTTDKIIAERRALMQKESQLAEESEDGSPPRKVYRPLLDLLLEAQERDPLSITDAGLRDEITTFIFAVCWFVFCEYPL